MKLHKKIVIIGLILLLTSTTSFAQMEEKLGGHWAKDSINKEFVTYYFPYLARDNFSQFNPNATMTKDSFALSTSALLKAKGYSVLGMENRGDLLRREMLDIIGSRLKKIGVKADPTFNLNFNDTQGLSNDEKDYLKILNKEKIILGVGGSNFKGEKNLTQAEAIVILQRLEDFINRLNRINFITRSYETTYNNKEEILTNITDTSVILSITKEFPTPGYSLSVKEILRQGDTFKVYLETKKPPADSIQIQVITYKTLQVEMQKSDLGPGPYNFVVEGFNK